MIAHMSPGSLEPILLISVMINLQQLQAEGQSLGQRLSQSVMRGPARPYVRDMCPLVKIEPQSSQYFTLRHLHELPLLAIMQHTCSLRQVMT